MRHFRCRHSADFFCSRRFHSSATSPIVLGFPSCIQAMNSRFNLQPERTTPLKNGVHFECFYIICSLLAFLLWFYLYANRMYPSSDIHSLARNILLSGGVIVRWSALIICLWMHLLIHYIFLNVLSTSYAHQMIPRDCWESLYWLKAFAFSFQFSAVIYKEDKLLSIIVASSV